MSDDAPEDLHELGRQRAATPRSLPTTYVDPHTGQQFTKAAPITGVTEEDIRRYGHGGHTCGECKHFEPGHAHAIMARTKFIRQLAKDQELNPRHFGMTRETAAEIGLCGDSGDMATTAFAPACAHFRESRGRIKKEASATERELVVNDMRAASKDVRDRFQKFKQDNHLDDPEYV